MRVVSLFYFITLSHSHILTFSPSHLIYLFSINFNYKVDISIIDTKFNEVSPSALIFNSQFSIFNSLLTFSHSHRISLFSINFNYKVDISRIDTKFNEARLPALIFNFQFSIFNFQFPHLSYHFLLFKP